MPELDLGNVKGPQGKSAYQSALDAGYSGSEEAFNTAMAKAPDAVLYTAQSLSDTQKSQARGNINAAPGGFGLGSNAKVLTSNDDVNDISASGWYSWYEASVPKNAIKLSWVTIMRVDAHLGGVFVQTAYGVTDANNYYTQPIVARRMRYSSKIGEWEYLNPPMELGTEYRTTERYLGKPVYVKAVDCGQIADGKEVAHGIDNMLYCIFAQGLRGGMPMPVIFNHSLSDPWSCYISQVTATKIRFECGTSAAGGNCAVLFKYTKTTD